jgi:DNA-binding response OmpR family regulator
MADDGLRALDVFDEVWPDLALVSLRLGDLSGLDLCRRLRRRFRVPVVMLATNSPACQPEVGLGLGADDYVVWPHRKREMVARLRAVLRRTSTHRAAPVVDDMFEIDDLVLDPRGYEARIAGQRVQLTPTDFELLTLFVTNPGLPMTKETLGERLWGPDYDVGSRRVEENVNRLAARRPRRPQRRPCARSATPSGSGFETYSPASRSPWRDSRLPRTPPPIRAASHIDSTGTESYSHGPWTG